MSTLESSLRSEVINSSNHYFSLDDILASQERIPLVTQQDLPQLGFLDPQSHYQTDPTVLVTGTTLELPLWMAKDLKVRNRAKLELPDSWSSSKREIIKADPSVLDLHKLGPYFYQTGYHILKLILNNQNLNDDAEAISNILVDTLTKRFRNIMDASANSEAQDTLINTGNYILWQIKKQLGYYFTPCATAFFKILTLNFSETLDAIERGLYRVGQHSRRLGDAWFSRTTGKIQTALIVQKHMKLKRKADVLNS